MAIEDILARISSDTDKEIDSLKRDADGKIEGIESEGKREADSVRKKILADVSLEIEAERSKGMSIERVEERKTVLAQKRRILEEVLSESWSKLRNMTDELYNEIFRHLLLELAESSDGEVFIRKADAGRITDNFLEEVNCAFSASGKKARLKRADEFAKFEDGGFILKEGRKQTDCTFSSLFGILKEELEPQIAKVLFISVHGSQFTVEE